MSKSERKICRETNIPMNKAGSTTFTQILISFFIFTNDKNFKQGKDVFLLPQGYITEYQACDNRSNHLKVLHGKHDNIKKGRHQIGLVFSNEAPSNFSNNLSCSYCVH